MKNKKFATLITIIIGIFTIIYSWIHYGTFSFIFGGLGIALIGISIEIYLKESKDSTTQNGKSRNIIDMHDERTIFINAKSGELVNYIMDFCTIIALIIAKLLNISLVGMIIILSLILIRLLINPIIRNYYENHV
ncbi:hypothetical protein SH2C18_48380 [Clostridium sediminicola]|uniref:hypothetical protein n=1 Tax=Clostridium sediminicola TaxID=3114879 RepID=UPI0031F1D984